MTMTWIRVGDIPHYGNPPEAERHVRECSRGGGRASRPLTLRAMKRPTGERRPPPFTFLRWGASFLLCLACLTAASGCARVRPWERDRLASPAMQFQMAPLATSQLDSVLEI